MDPEIKDEGMNIDEGVATIAGDLGLGIEDAPTDEPLLEDGAAEVIAETPPVETAPVRQPPKSWAKETHELWGKIPPEAQAQIEHREKQMLEGLETYKQDSGLGRLMRETVTPYKALLAAQGVDEVKAVSVLMNAHYKLSTLPGDQKAQYFASLAQTYGIDLGGVTTATQQVDPALKAANDRLDRIENSLTKREQEQFETHRTRVSSEVETFAKDPANPYFDEVADDIIVYLNAGAALPDAYKKAVWANPVTREKEIARIQTEAAANAKAKRATEAAAALKARGTNVRSRDTSRAPTEPLGKMDDTMKETLAEIRSRTH